MQAFYRKLVQTNYDCAVMKNQKAYLNGDVHATKEYVYANQEEDASKIVDTFYKNPDIYSIILQKKVKVGAMGLIIEVMRLVCLHPDDSFLMNPDHVYVITGMSNVEWQKSFAEVAPECFCKNILHRSRLKRLNFKNMRDALVIVDEIDTGEKPQQTLHKLLDAGTLMDLRELRDRNVRFLFVSATIMKQLHELRFWGKHSCHMKMTIPDNYIGHKQFLEKGLIQEYYPLKDKKSVDKWLTEDVLSYEDDYRIHLVRLTNKNSHIMRERCMAYQIEFIENNSESALSKEEMDHVFDIRKHHVVLAVKGKMRRADFVPNQYKIRVGAIMEHYSTKKDYNVNVQGLVGRLNGYDWLPSKHRTGPFRCHVKAIQEYEAAYEEPFGENNYECWGFRKVKGDIDISKEKAIMLSKQHVSNLPEDVSMLPRISRKKRNVYSKQDRGMQIFESVREARCFAHKVLKFPESIQLVGDMEKQRRGNFYTTNAPHKRVYTVDEIIAFMTKDGMLKCTMLPTHTSDQVGKMTQRTFMCYQDLNDPNSFRVVLTWAKIEAINTL